MMKANQINHQPNRCRNNFRERENHQPAPARSGASAVLLLALTTLRGTRQSGNGFSPQAPAANLEASGPPRLQWMLPMTPIR